jgi:pantothenate kinase type III
MDLVLDIGNTETVIGWFEDATLRTHLRVRLEATARQV